MKAKNLKFQPFHEAPDQPLVCNNCGRKFTTKKGLFVDVDFAKDATFMIVVCSKDCEKAFKASPFSDGYIQNRVTEFMEHHQQHPPTHQDEVIAMVTQAAKNIGLDLEVVIPQRPTIDNHEDFCR